MSTSAETLNENKAMTINTSTGPIETSVKHFPFKAPRFIESFSQKSEKSEYSSYSASSSPKCSSQQYLKKKMNNITLSSSGNASATFLHSGTGGAAAGKKNRTWKNLKQILSSERTLPWQLNDPSYFSIDALTSFKPVKKYSDISGLPANYTDPQSKLRFSTTEEFAYIRMLPSDVILGYLTLRKATNVVP